MTEARRIDYTVTFLEMTEPPARPRLPVPHGQIALMRAVHPPVHFFRYLYKAVGAVHEWTDLDSQSDAMLAEFVQSPKVELYVAHLDGSPAGFAMLDFREEGVCDIAYFGLIPEATGAGLGRWLLMEAIHLAWDREIARMTVNTCTLDHAAALPLYQKCGFVPVRQERRTRIASA